MRNWTIASVEKLVEMALNSDIKTGDEWLDDRYREDIQIIGHVNPYYRWFYHIASRYKPAFTVELGSWRATAAAHFAAGNPNGEVLTIDIHREDKVAQVKAREADAHYPNLHYINAWTWDAVPVVAQWKREIELLYIDSWHEYEYAMKDWESYSPLLADGAMVIGDDLFDAQGATIGMIRFWEEISAGCDSLIATAPHCGIPMGVFRYERRAH